MKSYLNYFAIAVIYYVAIIALSLSYFVFFEHSKLDLKIFDYLDAAHYYAIFQNGYASTIDMAFFPLFPFVWKALHFDIVQISIFNAFLYIGCLAFIGKEEKLKSLDYILILTIPNAVFYFIPYSEAIYFFCCCLLLYSFDISIILVFIIQK